MLHLFEKRVNNMEEILQNIDMWNFEASDMHYSWCILSLKASFKNPQIYANEQKVGFITSLLLFWVQKWWHPSHDTGKTRNKFLSQDK